MKHTASVLLTCTLLLSTSGCMTAMTIDAAKGEKHKDEDGAVVIDEKAKPGYYAFLPVAVAVDGVTSPFQLFAAFMIVATGSH